MPQSGPTTAAIADEALPIGHCIKGEGKMCCRCAEPRLDELLGDPVLLMLMAGDRVTPAELQRLIEQARRNRRALDEQRVAPN
jgi:hypothetical protein